MSLSRHISRRFERHWTLKCHIAPGNTPKTAKISRDFAIVSHSRHIRKTPLHARRKAILAGFAVFMGVLCHIGARAAGIPFKQLFKRRFSSVFMPFKRLNPATRKIPSNLCWIFSWIFSWIFKTSKTKKRNIVVGYSVGYSKVGKNTPDNIGDRVYKMGDLS